MDHLLRYLGMGACVIVLLAVICRIDAMDKRITRVPWFIAYLMFAAYALGVLLDLLCERYIDWYETAGVGGLLLYMVLTWRLWKGDRQDPETVRSELRRSDGSVVG